MSLFELGKSLIEAKNDENEDNESKINSYNDANTISKTPKDEDFILNGSKLADYIEINEDDLTFYERCGRGAYGTVYRGLWKSRNKIVAIKKLLQLDNNEAEVRFK